MTEKNANQRVKEAGTDMASNNICIEDMQPAFIDVLKYVLSHESDIANDMEDFGELRAFFIAAFKREPEK